ncbi:MAG: hypothetical protein ABL986_08815 [Vicinamibacterales bacterium]
MTHAFRDPAALTVLLTAHLPICRKHHRRISACEIVEVIAGRRDKVFALADVTLVDEVGVVVDRRLVLQALPDQPSAAEEGAKIFRRLRQRVRKTSSRALFRPWAAYVRSERLIVAPFPFDYRLPSLVAACDQVGALEVLGPALGLPLSACAVTAVRYVPEKRCQLRYDLATQDGAQLRVYGKVMAGQRGGDMVRWMQTLHDRLAMSGVARTPAPVGYLARLKLLLQHEAPGRTIYELQFDGKAPAALYADTGLALAAFQDTRLTGLDPYGASDEHAMLVTTLRKDILAPATRVTARALVEQLADSAPLLADEPPVTCHRDFYDKQVLAGRGIWFIDLDTLAEAPAALDVGNFLAHLRLRRHQNLVPRDVAATAATAFLSAYRRRRLISASDTAWWTASALIRLASVYAVRPRWVHLSTTLLADAQRELNRHFTRAHAADAGHGHASVA